MQEPSVLEAVLARDRLIVLLGLVTVIGLAWAYLLLGAGMDMTAMDMAGHGSSMSAQHDRGEALRRAHAAMLHPAVWTPGYALLMVVMWWVMMVAMMLPSAAPMILLFARIQRSQQAKGTPFVPALKRESQDLVTLALPARGPTRPPASRHRSAQLAAYSACGCSHGGTRESKTSRGLHTRSVNPAAIAGVHGRHCFAEPLPLVSTGCGRGWRNATGGKQKL